MSNFVTPQNLSISSDNFWSFQPHIASPLSFFVDANFNESNRKWFWGNGNEIPSDDWIFDCNVHPHEPATDFAITIHGQGIFCRIRVPRGTILPPSGAKVTMISTRSELFEGNINLVRILRAIVSLHQKCFERQLTK